MNGQKIIAKYVPIIIIGPDGQVWTRAKADPAATRSNIAAKAVEMVGRTNAGEVTTRAGSSSESRDEVEVSVYLTCLGTGEQKTTPNIKNRESFGGNFLIGADLLGDLNLLGDTEENYFRGVDEVEEARK